MGRGPNWTAEEIAILRRERARNASWREIAEATGHPADSCKRKSGALNLSRSKRSRWTAESEAELLRLRDVEGLSWFDIDGHFNRMHGACSHKYNELNSGSVSSQPAPRRTQRTREMKPKQAPPEKITHAHWTDADMQLAQTRWRELFVNVFGESAPREERSRVFEIIGRELKRAPSAIAYRLTSYGASFGMDWASKPLTQPSEVSQAMLDARALYAARLRQSPTAALLGDPPPGYSELDKRRACSGSSISMPSGPVR